MNLAVALDGGSRHTQNEETDQRTKIHYEEGQYGTLARLPSKEEEAQEETGKASKGTRFTILATESDQVFSRRA